MRFLDVMSISYILQFGTMWYSVSMAKKSRKVICAMSGGVDSSVSAALLKKAGYNTIGVFMKCWANAPCSAEEDEKWARRAAAKIGIPFYSVDLVGEYEKRVFNYFISEYKAGRTPNPDVMCNREIKFGVFYDWAVNELGADYVATGHYARLRNTKAYAYTEKDSHIRKKCVFPSLLRGIDSNKDQSYFLWAVPRLKFQNVIFPVGGYLKPKVRMMARRFGLPNAERKDSQGICFVGKVNFGVFLRRYIEDKPGKIVNGEGEVIGKHRGLHYYTIGQRQGIQIGGGQPYYVAKKDYKKNTLIVAREYAGELFYEHLIASDVNWIAPKPELPFYSKAKIRYRHSDQDAIIKSEDAHGNLYITFPQPQRAVTPGQSIVFYREDELIGGGIIN